LDLMMHEWLVAPDFGALAPGLHFAAGAIAVVLVQAVIVAGKGLLAWWRGSRALEFPPEDPTRIWAELKDLRGECTASATSLESVVAKLKDAAAAQIVLRRNAADRLDSLQRALDEQAATVAALEQQKTELELVQEQLLLQLQRQDGELGSRSDALANAQRTIALLQGLIGMPEHAPPQSPRRAAG
jgi:hypothetical protein